LLNLSLSEKHPLGDIILVNTKKMRDETDGGESTGNCLEVNDIEPINTRPDPKEIRDLIQ
ncbi:15404_t:CDS:2, partial [Gigaspora margarita]